MNNDNTTEIGFFGLLQIVLITLKLCGVINWNWWVVFTPIWAWIAFFIIGVLVIIICDR